MLLLKLDIVSDGNCNPVSPESTMSLMSKASKVSKGSKVSKVIKLNFKFNLIAHLLVKFVHLFVAVAI